MSTLALHVHMFLMVQMAIFRLCAACREDWKQTFIPLHSLRLPTTGLGSCLMNEGFIYLKVWVLVYAGLPVLNNCPLCTKFGAQPRLTIRTNLARMEPMPNRARKLYFVFCDHLLWPSSFYIWKVTIAIEAKVT